MAFQQSTRAQDAGVAQDATVRADDGTDGDSTGVLEPPELVTIDSPRTEGGPLILELLIEVSATGQATLLECPYVGAVCVEVHRVLQGASIKPAKQAGQPIAAQIPLRLQTQNPPAAHALSDPGKRPQAQTSDAAEEREFSARGEIEKLQGEREFKLRELRDVPGAFGDPFRAITALPSVVPVLSGVPYVYIRGAPPAGNAYYYDDIPVPALFHLALGPSVLHPRMIGDVDLFAAAAPAQYGRFVGALIRGRGPDAPPKGTSGEAELRLLDINGYVATHVGDAIIQAAGRYGYPGLLLSIFSPEASLAYWDYQLRVAYPLNDAHTLSVVWFGSYDSYDEIEDGEASNLVTMEFHRGEVRHHYQDGDLTLLSAVMLGYEQSSLNDQELAVESFHLRPRFMLRQRLSKSLTLETGIDYRITGGDINGNSTSTPIDDFDGEDLGLSESYLQDVAWRMQSGVFGALRIKAGQLQVDAGLRADLWATDKHLDAAPTVRLRALYSFNPYLTLHGGAALNYQPATFVYPLPGLAELAVDRGLQRSVQGELGTTLRLPELFELEVTGFLNHYNKVLFPDLVIDKALSCDGSTADCSDLRGNAPRAGGLAYGVEFFVRRALAKHMTGWVGYTLGAARARTEGGIEFPTEADVRHSVNVVAEADLGAGFSLGMRFFVRSGKAQTQIGRFGIATRRLPAFHRFDAHAAYRWKTSWGGFRLALEWFNITMRREAIEYRCFDDFDSESCSEEDIEYAPAIFFPSLSLRATF